MRLHAHLCDGTTGQPGADQPDGWGRPEILMERPSSATTGGAVNVTPGTAELTFTGYAPTVTTGPSS